MVNKRKLNRMLALVKFHFLTSMQGADNKKNKKRKDDLLGTDTAFASESIAKRIFKYFAAIFFSFIFVAVMLAIQGYGSAQMALAQGIFAENLTVMMLAMLLMSTMFGLLMYSNVMYYDKKADFLNVLPISKDEIFWSKFAFLYVNQAPVAMILFLPLAYASAAGAKLGAGSYFILTIIPFFIPLISLFVSTIISLPLNYIVSKVKKKEFTKNLILGIFSALMLIPVIVFMIFSGGGGEEEEQMANIQASMQGVIRKAAYVAYPIYAFVKAALFMEGSGMMVLYTLIIFIAITIITIVLSKLLYAKASTNLEDVVVAKKMKQEKKPVKGKLAVLVKREEKRLLKLPGNSINIIIGMLMPFFMIVPSMFSVVKEAGGIANIYKIAIASGLTNTVSSVSMGMYFFAIAMAVVYVNISFTVPMSSEHRVGIDYLLSLPISLEELVKAKFITNLKFSLLFNIPIMLFFLAMAPILKLAFIFLLINGALVSLASISIIYLVDLSKPYLDWTNVAEIRQKFRANIPLMIGLLIAMLQLPIALPIAIFTFQIFHSYAILYLVITVFNVIIFLIPFLILKKNYKKYIARLQA
jgi:ABC-2 type transport system permease protein